jgi:hypothetical protein
MSQRAYLVWDHDEYGPEDLRATLNKASVDALIQGWAGPMLEEAQRRLAAALDKDEVGITALGDGWGGWHLQIVELEP